MTKYHNTKRSMLLIEAMSNLTAINGIPLTKVGALDDRLQTLNNAQLEALAFGDGITWQQVLAQPITNITGVE